MNILINLLTLLRSNKTKLLYGVAAIAILTTITCGVAKVYSNYTAKKFQHSMQELEAKQKQVQADRAIADQKLKEIDQKLSDQKAQQLLLETKAKDLSAKIAVLKATLSEFQPTIKQLEEKGLNSLYTAPIPAPAKQTVDAVTAVYSTAMVGVLKQLDTAEATISTQDELITTLTGQVDSLNTTVALAESARALEQSKTLTAYKELDIVNQQVKIVSDRLEDTSKTLDKTKTQRNYSLVGNAIFITTLLIIL